MQISRLTKKLTGDKERIQSVRREIKRSATQLQLARGRCKDTQEQAKALQEGRHDMQVCARVCVYVCNCTRECIYEGWAYVCLSIWVWV